MQLFLYVIPAYEPGSIITRTGEIPGSVKRQIFDKPGMTITVDLTCYIIYLLQ